MIHPTSIRMLGSILTLAFMVPFWLSLTHHLPSPPKQRLIMPIVGLKDAVFQQPNRAITSGGISMPLSGGGLAPVPADIPASYHPQAPREKRLQTVSQVRWV
jgi:hypothetical protein